MAMSIAVALIQSRLDYANSILYHTAASNITKLQRIQNTAAHLVLPYSHLSANESTLTQLHWLPISRRIEFKLATITYKLLNTEQPSYLRSLIHYDNPVRQLRSSVQRRLHVPAVKTTIGDRAFSSASPNVWNSLPLSIRLAPSLLSFKNKLKTFYFNST